MQCRQARDSSGRASRCPKKSFSWFQDSCFKFQWFKIFFSVAVFLPLKRLNPERVTGLVENLSESLLSRKFGADTVSTLVREQSL